MADLVKDFGEAMRPGREFSVFVAAEAYPDLEDELLDPWRGLDPDSECRLPDTPTAAEVEATSRLAQFHPPEPWEDQAGWLDIAASLKLCVSTDTSIDHNLARRIGKALRLRTNEPATVNTNDGVDDDSTFSQNNLPMNDRVTALCRHLKDKRAKFPSEAECARDFCRKKRIAADEAPSLLRQARRFEHLWK